LNLLALLGELSHHCGTGGFSQPPQFSQRVRLVPWPVGEAYPHQQGEFLFDAEFRTGFVESHRFF